MYLFTEFNILLIDTNKLIKQETFKRRSAEITYTQISCHYHDDENDFECLMGI